MLTFANPFVLTFVYQLQTKNSDDKLHVTSQKESTRQLTANEKKPRYMQILWERIACFRNK